VLHREHVGLPSTTDSHQHAKDKSACLSGFVARSHKTQVCRQPACASMELALRTSVS
jgi:hypothetical protein